MSPQSSSGVRAALAAAALSLALTGCISVFPKSNPAQLYRFGEGPATAPADTGAASAAARPEIIKGTVDFNQAAAGDRILTVTGQETAYIAESRWVSPATTLFDEALDRAFASPPAPRLEGFGRGARGVAILRMTVDNFETRYENGPDAAPTVVVRIDAVLVSTKNRGVLAETVIEARKPASENRVGPIVQAYDAAVAEAMVKLTGWTSTVAAGAPA